MTERQLADRIGHVNDKLVMEAAGKPRRGSHRLWRRITAVAAALAIVIAAVLWLSLRGDPVTANAQDLMQGVTASKNVPTTDVNGPGAAAVTDFGLRLLRACGAGKGNTLLSPLSVICALGMTANGGSGETLAQMEAVLGMGVEELNVYLHSYLAAISQKEISVANSIWIRDDENLTVRDEFLQANADYYGAAAYKAPFDDTTVNDVNDWISAETDGMIENMLDSIDPDAVMLLVNALSFEAEWTKTFKESQVWDQTFTTEEGEERTVEMMSDTLYSYIHDEYAKGFIKPYKNGNYAFAALLPEEGMTVEDYLATLTGEGLHEMLKNADSSVLGRTRIPKFKSAYTSELADILSDMGMPDAFGEFIADFSGIYDGLGVYISRVLHKTFIEVAEQGTRAGAATVVEMLPESAEPVTGDDIEYIEIYLDRPFVYMIIDLAANVPIFLGTVMDIGE